MNRSQVWTSFGFHKNGSNTFPNQPCSLELQHEEYNKLPKRLIKRRRQGQQKQRVFEATLRRLLWQKVRIEKERLQIVYSKDLTESEQQQHVSDNLSDFLEVFALPQELQEDEEALEWYKEHVENAFKSSTKYLKEKQRRRPASAMTSQRLKENRVFKEDGSFPIPRVREKRTRTKSAPPTCAKKLINKTSTATQYADMELSEIAKFRPKSGCMYCPVECRPLSSSSYNQRSSTGLQSTPGPSHFHYFHYKKYFLYQRPCAELDKFGAAAGIRRRHSYGFEASRRPDSASQDFSNIARACIMHERYGKTRKAHSARASRMSEADEHPQRREAWIEIQTSREEEEKEYYSMDFDKTGEYSDDEQDGDISSAQVTIEPAIPEVTISSMLPDDASDGDIESNADNNEGESSRQATLVTKNQAAKRRNDDVRFNDDVRLQAEESYALASSNKAMEPESVSDDDRDPGGTSRLNSMTLPASTLAFSGSESSEGGQETDQKEKEEPTDSFYRPQPTQSTDMLSGEVYVSGLDIAQSHDSFLPSDDSSITPIVVRLPEPLPIIRVPEPEILTVDVVPPREELNILDTGDFDKIEDDAFPTDRTGTISEPETVPDESTDLAVERLPSILKSPSHETDRPRSRSKVTFELDEIKIEEVPLEIESLPEAEEIKPLETASTEEIEKDDMETPDDDVIVDVIKSPSPEPPASPQAHPSVIISTPEVLEVPEPPQPTRRPISPLYQDPDDEYLRKLLKAPDLHGFEDPEYEPASEKPKKKKKKKGKGKKKKTKKKSAVEAVSEPEEPLFSYIKRCDRESTEVTATLDAETMKDNTEMQNLVTAVRQFEDSYKERMKSQPWLFGRMALSKQICRFWLPVDLRELEGLSPSQYLINYCILTKRRHKLYALAFDRQIHKRKAKPSDPDLLHSLTVKETDLALRSLHGESITDKDVSEVYDLVCIREEAKNPLYVDKLSKELFVNMCALTERTFYNKFITEDAEETESSHRDRLEVADFNGIEWKLRNVNVSAELKRLFHNL